jgi:hypothetical protein
MSVIDERKYLDTYKPVWIPNEVHQIPSESDNGYFYIQLNEVPIASSFKSNNIYINDYIEIFSGLPKPNQFRVDYGNGKVYFHSSSAGDVVVVNYFGIGTVVKAEKFNLFQTKDNIYLSIKNNSGSTISAGTVVKYAESNYLDKKLSIEPVSDVTTDTPSGVVVYDILDGKEGEILIYGSYLLNTSDRVVNDKIYVNNSGQIVFTGTKEIGKVLSVSNIGMCSINLFGSTVEETGSGSGLTPYQENYLKLKSRELFYGV